MSDVSDLPCITAYYPVHFHSQTNKPYIILGIAGKDYIEALSLHDGMVALFMKEGNDAFEARGTVVSEVDLPGTGRKYWFALLDPTSLRFTSADPSSEITNTA